MNIVAAIIVFGVVISFSSIIHGQWSLLPQSFLFSAIIIIVAIGGKKLMAEMIDIGVEHRIIKWSRYGWRPQDHFDKEVPAGIILPLLVSLITLGALKFSIFLSYEATALKRRAARRFGYFSYSMLSEWHNGLIGAGGILSVLLLSFVVYFIPYNLEALAKMAAYYAFWNMLPISKSDGTQIYFGSKVLWITIAVITAIFTVYALGLR